MASPAASKKQEAAEASAHPSLSTLLPQGDLLLRLIEHSTWPISIHIYAVDGRNPRIVHANPTLCRMTGLSLRELASREAINLSGLVPALNDLADAGEDERPLFRISAPLVRDFSGGPVDTLTVVLRKLPSGQIMLLRIAEVAAPPTAPVQALPAAISPPPAASPDMDEAMLLNVSKALSASIEAMLQTTSAAGDDSSDYHKALMDFRDVLQAKPDVSAVTEAVNRIGEHTLHLATEFRQAREKLAESSQHIADLRNTLVEAQEKGLIDDLTSVGNRRKFELEVQRVMEESKSAGRHFCLLMADIDHFKRFNDEHGHQTGDMILRMVGRSLSAKLRATDIVTRYGGEEFAIILPATQLSQARTAAENIRKDVAQRRFRKRLTGESLGGVTISVGIAEWSPSKSIPELVEDADRALYAAKRAGRNRIATSTN